MGKHYKLPFSLKIERKYNDINVEDFTRDWIETEEKRQKRSVLMDNDLHIELNKFQTFDVSFDEIVDFAIRYAFSKREFSKLSAMLIDAKKENI